MNITVPKSTCPYIAVPVPGERPFIVARQLFVAATKGVNITDCQMQRGESGERASRILVITHRTGKTHGCYKFRDLSGLQMWQVKDAITSWADRERKKRREAQPVPQSVTVKFRTAMHRIQRKLDDIGTPKPPQHPYLYTPRPYDGGRYEREQWESWSEMRPRRKAIADIARLVLKHHITATTGYKRLREAGFTVRTFGQLSVNQKRRWQSEESYWKNAWESACGLGAYNSNPRDWNARDETDELKQHAEARKDYIAEIRERESLQSEMASVRLLAGVE